MAALKQGVAAHLQTCAGLQGARILGAHPGEARVYPLRRPAVAVGLEAVELAPGGFGDRWGGGDGEALYGGLARIGVRFDLYCPPGGGGDGCHGLYEALCDALLLQTSPFGFLRLRCGAVSFDRTAGAYHQEAVGELRAALTKRDDDPAIREIVLRHRRGEDHGF